VTTFGHGRQRLVNGQVRKVRKDKLVIRCTRGEQVLSKLDLTVEASVGLVYGKLNVTSWGRVLKTLFGKNEFSY
jgi:hypothetical protein